MGHLTARFGDKIRELQPLLNLIRNAAQIRRKFFNCVAANMSGDVACPLRRIVENAIERWTRRRLHINCNGR